MLSHCIIVMTIVYSNRNVLKSSNSQKFFRNRRAKSNILNRRKKWRGNGLNASHAVHTYSAFRLKHLLCSVAIQVVVAAVAEQVVVVLAVLVVPMLAELVAYWWRRPTFAWPLVCKHSVHRTVPISYAVYLHICHLLWCHPDHPPQVYAMCSNSCWRCQTENEKREEKSRGIVRFFLSPLSSSS